MGEAKRKFKSVRTLTGQNQYRKYEDWEIGDIVIGKVVDFGEDKYKKKCPILEVEEAMFKDKAENKRVLGKRLLINSCGKLKKRIDSGDVAIGLTIQIEYLGKNVMEKGLYAGKEAHDVNIDIVEEESYEDESGL